VRPPELTTKDRYYSEFRDKVFVIEAEREAVEKPQVMTAILEGIKELLDHGIRVAMVFGKGTGFEENLRREFGARRHAETNRLIIPEAALGRICEERARIGRMITDLCRARGVHHRLFPESAVRAERRIAHGSTGVVAGLDVDGLLAALSDGRLAIVGFGGLDDRGQFLHVPSVSLAAEVAVETSARKLLFLTQEDGILLSGAAGRVRQLSFADLDGLLCLLQRRDHRGDLLLAGDVVAKVHSSIRAVAGGVGQIHLVAYSRLLEEILTRTGVGTMIERRQSHHVDHARAEDLAEIERLHVESQRYTSDRGTPYVKPLTRGDLKRLLVHTLVLKHRDVIVGKLHATEVSGTPGTLQIGGVVIAENHHDSQHGQLLLSEALVRLAGRGCDSAVAVTASERAKRLFSRCGGQTAAGHDWQSRLLERALQRYHPEEQSQVQLFAFALAESFVPPPEGQGQPS